MSRALACAIPFSTHPRRSDCDNKYLLLWFVRTFLLLSMDQSGCRRLAGTSDINVGEFGRCFPDSRGYFQAFKNSVPHGSLKMFFDELGYKGRPELFSMYTCLLGHKSLWKNPKWLQFHAKSIRAEQRVYKDRTGVNLLPSNAVDIVAARL